MPDPVLTAQWENAGAWTALGTPRNVTIKRGKSKALDKITAGTMVLTLPNEARQNDPAHNPAFANLNPGTRIRLQATYNAITYDLFTGYLERVSQQFGNVETPRDAEIIYEVVDGLALLAGAHVGSGFETDIKALGPRAWLRMGEHVGPWFYDRAGTTHGYGFGNIEYGATGFVQQDENGAARFPADNVSYMSTWPDFMPTDLPSFTISFILEFVPYPTANQYIFHDTRGFNVGLSCYVDTVGVIHVNYGNAGGTMVAHCQSAGAINGVYRYHIVVQAGQPIKLYSDYLLFSTVSSGVWPASPAVSNGYTHWGQSGSVPVTLDEIMVWTSALSVDTLYDIFISTLGWLYDFPSARINRILTVVDWNLADTVIGNVDEDGETLYVFEPTNALEHLQALAETIEGRVWIRPDGKLQFLSRGEHLGTPYDDSAATFTDVPGGLGYRGIGRYGEDWAMLANVIRRINRETITVASDDASIAEYGLRDESPAAEVQSLFATPAKDYDLAVFRLQHYKDPTPYIDGLELSPRGNVALWPVVLGLDLARRVTFERTPQGVGSPIVLETIIEGITHTIGPERWTTTYNVDSTSAQRYFKFNETLFGASDWRFSA